MAPLSQQHVAPIIKRVGMAGAQADRPLKIVHRRIRAPEEPEHISVTVQGVGLIGIEGDGPLETRQTLLRAPQARQGRAQIGMVVGHRPVDLHRPRKVREGGGVSALAVGDGAQQVHRPRMGRRDRQNLFADEARRGEITRLGQRDSPVDVGNRPARNPSRALVLRRPLLFKL